MRIRIAVCALIAATYALLYVGPPFVRESFAQSEDRTKRDLMERLGRGSAEKPDRVQRDLVQQLKDIERRTDSFFSGTGPVEATDVNVRGAYLATRAELFYEHQRGDIDRALARPELGPLRDYVDRYAPHIPSDRVKSPYGELIDAAEMKSFSVQNRDFVSRLVERVSDWQVTLSVESEPDGAKFSLLRISGTTVRELSTNGDMKSVYRGLYRYRLARAGYKAVEAELDLVNLTPVQLTCHLFPSSARDGPTPCNVQ